jgi:Rps23 Pro-64 3,4-dihydroxylase Tpa1-like proline 4-hydroxylase
MIEDIEMQTGNKPIPISEPSGGNAQSENDDPVQIDCNSRLDAQNLAHILLQDGRVRVPEFLSSGAEFLNGFLARTDDWIQVINNETGVMEIDLDEWLAIEPERRRTIQSAMYARASRGFQYSYAAIRIPQPDELDEDEGPLNEFAKFMAKPETKKTLETLTGYSDLQFTDGQATVYNPGDILTGHDDAVAGKKRIAAFVLGMTPVWRLEWGGLLHFHPEAGEPAIALVPQFNSLDLFLVPRLHSVSQVSPAALFPRFALTGWLSEA